MKDLLAGGDHVSPSGVDVLAVRQEELGIECARKGTSRWETSHAVTLHWMDVGIDTGAIAYSAEFEIGETDTGLSVSARVATVDEWVLVHRVRLGGEVAAGEALPEGERLRDGTDAKR